MHADLTMHRDVLGLLRATNGLLTQAPALGIAAIAAIAHTLVILEAGMGRRRNSRRRCGL